jgi:hypothetical protein
MNTFGWSFRSLHLPGPAQEAEFGRGICDDLLGEAAYPIPDGGVVSGKRRTPTTADSLYLIVLRQLHQTAVTGYPPALSSDPCPSGRSSRPLPRQGHSASPAAADWRAVPVQQFVDDNACPSKQQKRRLPALIAEEQWRWRRDLNPRRDPGQSAETPFTCEITLDVVRWDSPGLCPSVPRMCPRLPRAMAITKTSRKMRKAPSAWARGS